MSGSNVRRKWSITVTAFTTPARFPCLFSLTRVSLLHAHPADTVLLGKLPEGRPVHHGNIDRRVALLLRTRSTLFHQFTPTVGLLWPAYPYRPFRGKISVLRCQSAAQVQVDRIVAVPCDPATLRTEGLFAIGSRPNAKLPLLSRKELAIEIDHPRIDIAFLQSTLFSRPYCRSRIGQAEGFGCP